MVEVGPQGQDKTFSRSFSADADAPPRPMPPGGGQHSSFAPPRALPLDTDDEADKIFEHAPTSLGSWEGRIMVRGINLQPARCNQNTEKNCLPPDGRP